MHATSCALPRPRWSSSCGWRPPRQPLPCAAPKPLAGSAVCLSLPLLTLRFAAAGEFTLPGDGLHARDIPAHTAKLLQALRLSQSELELQLEELIVEIALLVEKFFGGQVADFLGFHRSVPGSRFLVLSSRFSVRCRLAFHEPGPQRQLVRSQTHGLGSVLRRDAFHFEQDLAGTNHGNPVIRGSLAFSHTGFSRLLGDGLVRKQPDPDLAATLHETRH